MMPTKIEDDVKFMEARPELAMCYSKMSTLDGNYKNEIFPPYRGSDNPFHDYLKVGNLILPTPTLFFKKKIFDIVGLYDERYICEDFDMTLRITFNHPVEFRDAYSIQYIIHSGSMTIAKKRKLYEDMISILKNKWRGIPNYNYYLRRRYLSMFYVFAKDNKLDSIKYMFKSISFCFTKIYLASIFELLFKWPPKK